MPQTPPNLKNLGSSLQKRILVIEDDKFLRELIAQKLIKEGYETSEAVDGEEGIKKIKEEKPDLILLDLILPKVHGFEVLNKLKEDEETKDIPVIVLTNLEGIGDVEKAIELGATTYLVKANYSLEEVIEKIKKALGEPR